MVTHDLIIIGGGCLGTALVNELIDQGLPVDTRVLEATAAKPQRDHNWSFWQAHKLPRDIQHLVHHRWPRWRFSDALGSELVEHYSTETPYCAVKAADFFSYSQEKRRHHPDVCYEYETTVSKIRPSDSHVTLHTNRGAYSARQVIDTRPIGAKSGIDLAEPLLFQCFSGVVVETAQDCFDPGCATLMGNLSYSVDTDGEALGFIYVLPFAPKRALIEYTVFSTQPWAQKKLKIKLKQYCNLRLKGIRYKEIAREEAMLPMGLAAPKTDIHTNDRIFQADPQRQMMRPATGYAFLNAHHYARWLARYVQARRSHQSLPHSYQANFSSPFDKLFLRTLREHMPQGPQIFLRMARGLSGASFARFMEDRFNAASWYRTVCALPKKPFLTSAYRTLQGHFDDAC